MTSSRLHIGRLLLGHSRTPEYSDVIPLLTTLTSETALVHKLFAPSRVVHLLYALVGNAFEDHHGDETDKQKAANDDSDDSASVSFVLLMNVVIHELGIIVIFPFLFKPLSLNLFRDYRCFRGGDFGSGLLTVDRLLLSIDAILNFSGFIGAEDVGAAGFDLLDSSDDISLDHVLVDLDLLPLFDSFCCGFNIQLFSFNQVLTSVDRIDKVSELNRIVCNNIAGCNLVGRFVI